MGVYEEAFLLTNAARMTRLHRMIRVFVPDFAHIELYSLDAKMELGTNFKAYCGKAAPV